MATDKVDTDAVWDHEAYLSECLNIKEQRRRLERSITLGVRNARKRLMEDQEDILKYGRVLNRVGPNDN